MERARRWRGAGRRASVERRSVLVCQEGAVVYDTCARMGHPGSQDGVARSSMVGPAGGGEIICFFELRHRK